MPAAAAPADNFDEAIKEFTPSGLPLCSKMCFLATAVLTSLIPAYIYYSNFFGVELSYYIVYIGVIAACTVLLFLTYMKVYDHEFGRIMERKKRYNEDMNEDAGRKEAIAYSMFVNNLIFIGGMALLSFVIMPRLSINLPSYVMFAVNSILAALFTFGCGYDYI